MRRFLQSAYLHLRHPGVLRALGELERTERLREEEILGLQAARLKALLSHASRHVPYYREAFRRAGVDPADGAAALRALPILTKEIIRTSAGSLLSEDASQRGAFGNATGGSTGEPLRFVQDRSYEIHRR
ncbi:MAG TPA: hypothetical protein VNI57_10600, partial [Candidatus Saccharimonadales bacterium]|nr:hypothetical protein [Candidatus Saccharimonadales bacterium]